MKTKYRALRTISLIYQILGVLVLVMLGILIITNIVRAISGDWTTIGLLSDSFHRYGWGDAILDSIGATLVLGIIALSLFATGELFTIFIDIEENTRATRSALMVMMRNGQQPSPRPSTYSEPPEGQSLLNKRQQNY